MAYAKATAPSASIFSDSVLRALLTLASPARHLHQQVGVAAARVQNIHDDFNGLWSNYAFGGVDAGRGRGDRAAAGKDGAAE